MDPIKLTQFSHGGGCGCKISPSILAQMLSNLPSSEIYHDLLVGTATGDDAAVYRVNDDQAIVATTDFFTPIVDDPFDFGCIAATNALSDLYAMGATPIFALALVGMPVEKLPIEVIKKILIGGETVCRKAGIPVAGGHSIDTLEPIYGLAALGLINPKAIKRNDTAQEGDFLILGKALGIGVLSAALKRGELSESAYRTMISSATQLNTPGERFSEIQHVHAMTDVTGFGLIGHTMKLSKGAGLKCLIDMHALPIFPEALALAKQGVATGAAERNWQNYKEQVSLSPKIMDWQRKLLCDPQTSGGLLVCCSEEAVSEVMATFHRQGFSHACVIGRTIKGTPEIIVS